MADQTRRTWDGAGFDDEADGFMKSDSESRQTRRVMPSGNPVPPPRPPDRSGRPSGGVLITVLVVAIVVLGGVIVWRTFMDMKPNTTDASMVMSTPERSQEVSPSTQRVDTGVVVRQEQVSQGKPSSIEPTTSQERRTPATSPGASSDRSASAAAVATAPLPSAPVDPATSKVERSAPTPDQASQQAASVKPPEPVRNVAEAPRTAMSITPAPKGTPVYVVQVFSSPARDDAEEWMQILRSRNVRDAFISEQRIKGDTWYRVRFGQFAKRQDAENAALKIGVNQPWIARIK